jgi:hypothetical protein
MHRGGAGPLYEFETEREVAEFFGPVSWSSGRSLGCCGRSPLARHRCPRDGITSRRARDGMHGDEVSIP